MSSIGIMTHARETAAPACPYCPLTPELVSGAVIYPQRPDLADLRFWRCAPCGAWVGCHKGTNTPFGRLANKRLREWKARAHAAFDPLWRRKMAAQGIRQRDARGAGYAWLASQLGIAGEDCHIGMFDEALCRRVVEVCAPYSRNRTDGGAS